MAGFFSNEEVMKSLSSMPGPLPKFVTEPDEKYRCLICKNILRTPVMTECGHRMCKTCIEKLVLEANGTIACPAQQEDCEDVTMETVSVFESIFLLYSHDSGEPLDLFI